MTSLLREYFLKAKKAAFLSGWKGKGRADQQVYLKWLPVSQQHVKGAAEAGAPSFSLTVVITGSRSLPDDLSDLLGNAES